MSKQLGIEQKIEKLWEFMQQIHDRLDLHEWVKDYRPWNEKPNPTKRTRKHICATYCEHHIHWIKCFCGENRKATLAEYDAADQEYDGY